MSDISLLMDQHHSQLFQSIESASNVPDKVTLLDLRQSSYEQIPDEIQNFIHLKSLILSSMSFPIPDWITNLNELEYLEIVQHNFDHIPDQLLDLQDLKVLIIGESIEGKGIRRIEDNVLRCKSLETLELDFNPIEYITSGLSNHPNLSTLNLYGERETKLEYFPKLKQLKHLELQDFLMERLPAGLEYCHQLESLSLSHNNLKTIDLSSFTSLKKLKLNTNQIRSIRSSAGLEKLNKLELGSNGLTLFPGKITDFTELKELDLSHNDLVKLPTEITELSKLEIFNIRNNELTELPHEFGKIASLRYLDVSRNLLRDLPSSFKELKELEILDLSQNKLLRLPPFMEVFKNLRKLNLNLNQLFSQSYSLPDSIGKLNLKSLNLGNNQLEFIPEYLSEIPLERLDLSNNSISFLPQNMKNWGGLKQMYLHNNPIIKLTSGLESLVSLEDLNLDHVSIMDWQENVDQISALPALKSLSLRFNGITNIAEGIKKLKHLKMIDIRRNALEDSEKEEILQALSPHCKVYI